MQEKETRIVVGEAPKPETLTLKPSPNVAQAAGILLQQAGRVSRGRVKRAIRGRRLQQHPIVPGGGTRERARRLRQLAAQQTNPPAQDSTAETTDGSTS